MYNSIYDSLIIGKKVIYLPSCHSTNDIAAELVQNGLAEEGTVVITDNQVSGRGQRGSEWHSEPFKNLTFSVILKPVFLPIMEQFLISQVVALAIYKYLSTYTNRVKIKWPNDIYIGSKKISGTLIENSIQGTAISHSIVGIGLNLNQISFLSPRVSSLVQVIGHELLLPAEFAKLIGFLDAGYLMLKAMKNNQQIKTQYLDNLHGYNRNVGFRYQNELVEGFVTGITDQGKLCVKINGQPEIHEFGLKEIEWIWQD